MKNNIISGLVLIVLGGLITKFFFDEKVELRYVLSDRIPTSFINGDNRESIQQLELFNSGDIEINRIIIRMR